jgi:hypothetical protein
MASNPTVSDLRKVSEVTDDQITAAVGAMLAGRKATKYLLAKGWKLDLVEMIRANQQLAWALKSDQTQWKRGMVRRAILHAHPVKE